MSKRILLPAALLFVVAAYYSAGYHQLDEHFQILEFAAYKLGLAEATDLPWEYHERMRPALQPALAYTIHRVVGWFGHTDPFTVAFILRLLSGALTLTVAGLLYRRYVPRISAGVRLWFVLLLFFHWCAYYSGVRFSSENWSGLFAVIGLLLYPLSRSGDPHRFTGAGGHSAFLAGACFGLAFLFRYQVGIMVAGFGAWLLFVERERWTSIAAVVAGGLSALLLAYPLSYWLYGEWTLPAWNYLAANLIEGKAATYGTRPWYAYPVLVFLRGIPPLSLVYLVGTVGFCWWFRRDPLTWMVVAFVVVHSALARKDIRFLYPLIPLVPVLVAGAATAWQRRGADGWWRKPLTRWLVALSAATNFVLLLAVLLRPAASEIAPARFVNQAYPGAATLTGPDAEIIDAEGATARYYGRPRHQIDSLSLVRPGSCGPAPCLFVTHTRETPAPPAAGKLVFTDRPEWIDTVNLGGWADRQKWWYIYEFR
ncbi:hypothetical protein [Lewinella sp. JB7]|uniref:hypothetical protein n=1 Tax=Lewinella sp. JB7 TaxID=2962887 RepID=UPI0020C95AD0|nr:hypothetical protein [Lewinella sp. JB7]MCP9235061.1 hypothetical protein [Lewinella sp. JB7]